LEVRLGREYITEKIRRMIADRPNISAELLCQELRLPYKKYRQLIYNEKSKIRKLVRSNATPSTPLVEYHRLVFVAIPELPPAFVGRIMERASRNPEGFGRWYVSDNRNRQLAFINDWVAAWLWPSGKMRVQIKKDSVGIEEGLRWVSVCLRAGELTDEEISTLKFTTEKHREFYIGRILPRFSIKDYKDRGIDEIGTTGSHPRAIQVRESAEWLSELVRNNVLLQEEISGLRADLRTLEESNHQVLKQLTETVSAIVRPSGPSQPEQQLEQSKGEPSYRG